MRSRLPSDETEHYPAGASDARAPPAVEPQPLAGGRCPIEAGLICRLADHECRHGRLAFDRTVPCGCWPEEGAAVRPLPEARGRARRPRNTRVAA